MVPLPNRWLQSGYVTFQQRKDGHVIEKKSCVVDENRRRLSLIVDTTSM